MKDPRRFSVTRTGDVVDGSRAASAVRIAVPLVFTVLFLMSVLMTSGYLMQGTATEKENKVVEVLLASANPQEILAGKLIGLAGAGLLQISVWLLMALGTGISVVPLLLSANVSIPWSAVALAVPLFLIAFLFFGSLIMGTGSLGSNMREAQQLAMAWSLLAALPLMMMGVLIRDPHGVLGARSDLDSLHGGIDDHDAHQHGCERDCLVGDCRIVPRDDRGRTWFAIRLGARLFRVGLLSRRSAEASARSLRQARPAD